MATAGGAGGENGIVGEGRDTAVRSIARRRSLIVLCNDVTVGADRIKDDPINACDAALRI